MSHPAPRPVSNEILVTLRVHPSTLAESIKHILQVISGVPVRVVDDASERPISPPDDADPPIPSNADPPDATPVLAAPSVAAPDGASGPELPAHLEARFYLGSLCKRQHRYENSEYSVRRRSNHGCEVCNTQYTLKPRAFGQRQTPTPDRPVLPAHLAMNAFLSPITCSDPTHRYRNLAQWTLRYQADETCVQCVTQQSRLALAGD